MNNKRGFTLAELLVVVAIIAVLVAISIPIFSSQLEKARQATDLANIRAAYAELMSYVITGDKEGTSFTAFGGNTVIKLSDNVYLDGNKYEYTGLKPTKKEYGWKYVSDATIGGINIEKLFQGNDRTSSESGAHWDLEVTLNDDGTYKLQGSSCVSTSLNGHYQY